MVTTKNFNLVLPLLDDTREISENQRNAFRENGHLLVRGLVNPAEMTLFRPLLLDVVKKIRSEKRKHPENSTPEKIHGISPASTNINMLKGGLTQVLNLWRVNEALKQFVLARRFARVAADLLGVNQVRIYHDRAFFMEPGTGPTPWHQDQYYWPLDTGNTVTMAIPLVDTAVEMGMLAFASGSHKQGTILDARGFDEADGKLRKYIKMNHLPVVRAAGMLAGDSSWHYGNTLHFAGGNESSRMKEMMTVIYMAEGTRITEPKHKAQVYEWKTWLMGLPPGTPAASELNPLVL